MVPSKSTITTSTSAHSSRLACQERTSRTPMIHQVNAATTPRATGNAHANPGGSGQASGEDEQPKVPAAARRQQPALVAVPQIQRGTAGRVADEEVPHCGEHAEQAGCHPTTHRHRQIQTRRGEHQPVHDPIEHRVEKSAEPATAVGDPGDLTVGAVEDARQLHQPAQPPPPSPPESPALRSTRQQWRARSPCPDAVPAQSTTAAV